MALFGTTKHKQRALFPMDPPLNALKRLWQLAENVNAYSEQPDYFATFVLRISYQQLPFVIHPDRVGPMLSRMCELLSTPDMKHYVANRLGATYDEFLPGFQGMFATFTSKSDIGRESFERNSEMKAAAKLLSANRLSRTVFYKQKLELKRPEQKPYEINSLLRYPIVEDDFRLFCPYAQLIAYAATRGLYFRFNEQDGDEFREPFVKSYEAYVARLLSRDALGAEVITEDDERKLGWFGKTNDVTAIFGNSAVLIECKLSGLYVEAKREASLDLIVKDVRKQIADGRERRGVFQLYDKIDAINRGLLPAQLQDRFKRVSNFYPVLLLFDDIAHANAPEVLGNIVRDELKANGVDGFQYQIWQLEELQWMIECAGSSFVGWIAEKFSRKMQMMDLGGFLADKSGKQFLKQTMFLPRGEGGGFDKLRSLADKYENITA